MALSNPTRRAPLAALALTATLATGAQAETYNGYEVPPYRVEARAGAFELRQYEPHLVAEVVVEGSRSSTASRGFRALANYIFGGNDRGEKIAMTVPVTQTPVDGGYRVRFAMPSRFDRTALPDPENRRRAASGTRQQPASRRAVLGLVDQAPPQGEGGGASGLDGRRRPDTCGRGPLLFLQRPLHRALEPSHRGGADGRARLLSRQLPR